MTTAWLCIGEYQYDASDGNGVYIRAFTTEEKAIVHRDWLQGVADKATSSLDDWCDYNFVVMDIDVEE